MWSCQWSSDVICKGKEEDKYFRRKKVELYVSLGCDLTLSNIDPYCLGPFSTYVAQSSFSAEGYDYVSAGGSVTFPFLKTIAGKKRKKNQSFLSRCVSFYPNGTD